MRFTFEVGHGEPHKVEFYWGQMFGALEIKVDSKIIEQRSVKLFSPTDFKLQNVPENEKMSLGLFEVQLVEKWSFEVGIYEKHQVSIEKQRPKILAGLRPHIYRVYVDDILIEQHKGY